MNGLPSRWWHLLSGLIFLVGAVGAPLAIPFLALSQIRSGEEFTVPGTFLLRVEKPGEFVIWNVVSTFRNGRQQDYPKTLPNGMRIRILDPARLEIPTEADMGASESAGGVERLSVCAFHTSTPGTHSVVVDMPGAAEAGGPTEQRLLMVRRSLSDLMLLCLGLGFISVLGWIIPIAISIIIEVRRFRKRKVMAVPAGK